jgi:beta-lactamase regulating signal transducer with metallopeptidase domain
VTQFLTALFEVSLTGSVIIGALLLLSPLLQRKYSARALSIVWLVLALRLLVPFSLRLPMPFITIPAPIQSAAADGSAAAPSSVSGGAPPVLSQPDTPSQQSGTAGYEIPVRRGPSAVELAAAVWAAGAASFALAHLIGYYLLRRNIRRYAKPYYDEAGLEMFRRLLSELGIPEGRIALLSYPKAGSPMMTGFYRPAILLPESCYDVPELALILRHELTHYRRKHLWFKLLLLCCNAVHWFNPLVWGMAREAGRLLENACDNEVVGAGDIRARKKYSETILSAMARDNARHIGLSTYYHGGKKTMKKRLMNIFDVSAKRRGAPLVAAALLAVLLSGALVACSSTVGAGPSSPSASAAPSPSPSEAASGSASPSPSQTALTAAIDTATAWATAVADRDGKAQYDLYTKEYQKEVYDELNGLNWVTGTSSPWVESFTIKDAAADSAVVTFQTATSAGPAGDYAVTLTFTQEDGAMKISGVSKPEPVTATPSPAASDPSAAVPSTAAPSTAPAEPSPSSGVTAAPAMPAPKFSFLKSLLGMSKADVTSAFDGLAPEAVDEGGLGFDKVGIRVWFDVKTYTKVAQVLIMSDAVDIDGVKVGDGYKAFKDKFGKPVSDTNGDAHFKYGDVYLSVVRDTSTDKVISVYILAEDF